MDRVGPVLFLLYAVGGLMQAAAIIGGLQDGMHLPWLLAIPIGGVGAFVPFVGAALCIYGAIVSFHWAWWAGVLLAFPQVLGMALGFLGQTIDDREQDRIRRAKYPDEVG